MAVLRSEACKKGRLRTSSKALRLRPDLARLGELCRGGSGDCGAASFGVMLTSAGALCMSLLSCSSSLATCEVDRLQPSSHRWQSLHTLTLAGDACRHDLLCALLYTICLSMCRAATPR